jgi:hypothetical protein
MKAALPVVLFALTVFLRVLGLGQEVPPDSSHRRDTIIYIPEMQQRPAENVTNAANLEKHLIQTPTVALFKSMLVPGLGQVGNRKILKAGLFIGLESWFALKAIKHGQSAHAYRAQYEAETDSSVRVNIYGLYGSERDKRNKFIWFFGLTTFVSMFDAYVDAHLSGSPSNPRNDQFSFNIGPDPRGGASAMLTLKF